MDFLFCALFLNIIFYFQILDAEETLDSDSDSSFEDDLDDPDYVPDSESSTDADIEETIETENILKTLINLVLSQPVKMMFFFILVISVWECIKFCVTCQCNPIQLLLSTLVILISFEKAK